MIKQRKDIADNYKWDLSSIYASDEKWKKDLKRCEELSKKCASYKGKLKNSDSFLEFLKTRDRFYTLLEKLYIFSSCKVDEDLRVGKNKERFNILNGEMVQLNKSLLFVGEEIKKLSEDYLESLIKDPRFEDYKLEIINNIREKPHVLDEKESCITNFVSLFSDGFSNVFNSLTNADLKFEPVIDNNGKRHTLTNSNIIKFFEDKDRNVRRQASENIKKGYKGVQNTLATNYISKVKQDWAFAQIHNYDSCLQYKMFSDNLDESIYDNLMENIESRIKLSDKYFKIRKRCLGLRDYARYDDYVPLSSFNKKYTYEQAIGVVFDALKVLGSDYTEILKKSQEQKWIDVYANEGKREGGYSTAGYKTHPFILLNFEGRINDVLTIAHELGHSAHSYYSTHNCAPANHDYTIMCAEVASTVNEVLTIKYLYNNSKTKQEKIRYISQYISEFIGTVFRQAQFSMFEHKAHRLIENNQPISKEILTKQYGDLVAKFNSTKKRTKDDTTWARIPHFYRSYYVYKYCIGFISAVCIAKNILDGKKNALENYKKFLKNGGKNFSLDTLKMAGIDLSNDLPYKTAFADMEWAVKELDKLTKK